MTLMLTFITFKQHEAQILNNLSNTEAGHCFFLKREYFFFLVKTE